MSRYIAVAVLAVIITISLISCAGAPAAKETVAQSRSELPVAVPAASEEPTESPEATESPESVTTSSPAGEPASGEPPAAADGSTGDPAPTPSPKNPDPPTDDRFIYFYPEPEIVVPAAGDAVTAEAAPSVPAPPVADPAADRPAPKKTESVSKPPKGQEVKPAPKPAAKGQEVKPASGGSSGTAKPPATGSNGEDRIEAPMPGIWLPEAVSPSLPVSESPRTPPSRTAAVPAGHTLEVWYPGSGWVYLGDASAQNGLSYETRKLEGEDTLFSFRAKQPGSYILEFSRFDVLGDTFVSDSVAVTVNEPGNTRTGRLRAPDYRSTLPVPADGQKADSRIPSGSDMPAMQDEPALGTVTSPVRAVSPAVPPTGTTGAVPATGTGSLSPDQLLEKTRAALAGGDTAAALGFLDTFFTVALTSLDEGWFLRGQAYEANGPLRNIRRALSAYETLVSAYPDSARWQEADARIRYIKQFYFRIR